MPKNKKPARKPGPRPAPTVDRTDELIEDLAVLALEVAEQEDSDDPALAAALLAKRDELLKMVRNALRKKQDEVLYGAIDHARFDDVGAYVLLRQQIEEAAGALVMRAEGKPPAEIDAFLVPLFVHSRAGLQSEAAFQDPAGFELLRASFQQAGLESDSATVVLISHMYDADAIDRISYSELNEMLREVAATMDEKKMVATPVLAASIASRPGADQQAAAVEEDEGTSRTELRFLLGFVRRRLDDPFYDIPADATGSEAWFSARLERYRQWTLMADPLLRACVAADPATVEINFLYQDQFFAAKRQALAEGDILVLMEQIGATLEEHEIDAELASAVVGPAVLEDDLALRVALYRNGDAEPLASYDFPYDLANDLDDSVDELCEILHGMGVSLLSTAARFGADGAAQQLRVWQAS